MNDINYNLTCNVVQLMDEIYNLINKKLYANNEADIVDGYVNYDGFILDLHFQEELTPEEVEIINNIIINHTPNYDYENGKKFKINNSTISPYKIDYDILGLNKKRTFVKGELIKTEYYKNYIFSSDTYSDLVVSEFREYIRDSIGIVKYRNQTSNWILNDNSTGLTLSFIKYYSPEQTIQEGIDRRNNMLSFAKTSLLSDLKNSVGEPTNQTYAFDLLLSVKTQMDYFQQGYTQPLRDAISASTKPYLTEQVKINIINELTF